MDSRTHLIRRRSKRVMHEFALYNRYILHHYQPLLISQHIFFHRRLVDQIPKFELMLAVSRKDFFHKMVKPEHLFDQYFLAKIPENPTIKVF